MEIGEDIKKDVGVKSKIMKDQTPSASVSQLKHRFLANPLKFCIIDKNVKTTQNLSNDKPLTLKSSSNLAGFSMDWAFSHTTLILFIRNGLVFSSGGLFLLFEYFPRFDNVTVVRDRNMVSVSNLVIL